MSKVSRLIPCDADTLVRLEELAARRPTLSVDSFGPYSEQDNATHRKASPYQCSYRITALTNGMKLGLKNIRTYFFTTR